MPKRHALARSVVLARSAVKRGLSVKVDAAFRVDMKDPTGRAVLFDQRANLLVGRGGKGARAEKLKGVRESSTTRAIKSDGLARAEGVGSPRRKPGEARAAGEGPSQELDPILQRCGRTRHLLRAPPRRGYRAGRPRETR